MEPFSHLRVPLPILCQVDEALTSTHNLKDRKEVGYLIDQRFKSSSEDIVGNNL